MVYVEYGLRGFGRFVLSMGLNLSTRDPWFSLPCRRDASAHVSKKGASALRVGPRRARETFGTNAEAWCPESTVGTLRTGGVVLQGVCTVAAGPSVQSPSQTGSPVYKAAHPEKAGVQSRALRTGRCALTVLRSATRPRATASHGGVPNRHLAGADPHIVQKPPFFAQTERPVIGLGCGECHRGR